MTVHDMIAKRKARWAEKGDLEYDKKICRASVRALLMDPSMRHEVEKRPYLLIELAFLIVDKKSRTVPFFFNEVQKDFVKNLEAYGTDKPYFILKGRQQGFTSLITAIQLSFAIVKKNFSGFTLADRVDNTAAIFNDKARVVYDRLPKELKPHEKFNSRTELFFDKLNSSWRIATATDNVARSRTLIFVHYSELAFYDCDIAALQKGIGEATAAGAFVVYETTANGFNEAKELWDSGSCRNLFYPFWLTAEYRSRDFEYLETNDSWLKKRIELLFELGLDREQVAWYCKKYASYIDKNTIRQEYPITPEEAFVASGECMFDKDILTDLLVKLSARPAPRRGVFEYKKTIVPLKNSDGETVDTEWRITDIVFRERADGFVVLYEEPRVKKDGEGYITHRAPYVLGGDTAGTGKDYFTAKVICNMDGRTAAVLQKQYIDEDLYALQVYCLGKYYNDAMIGVEINYSRQPTRILQKDLAYPNLYMRETLHGISDKAVMEYGFDTTPKTKPIIIGELISHMRNDPMTEVDIPTVREMLTFVKKDNGRMEAIDGCHDDLVMATAIARFIAKKQSTDWLPAESGDSDFLLRSFSHFSGENNGYWEV